MKKFFVALFALALIAGNAFAEVTWGGAIQEGVKAAMSSTKKDSDIWAERSVHQGKLWATFANEEDTFGAYARVQGNDSAAAFSHVYGWWQPISQLKLTLGKNPDGQFGVNYIVGWSFHAAPGDYVVSSTFEHGAWAKGGFGDFGATLSIKPMEGLAINLAIPYTAAEKDKQFKAAEQYNHIQAQVVYTISNIGEIAVSFTGSNNRLTIDSANSSSKDWNKAFKRDANAIYGQFYLTAVENLSLNVGLKYTLPVSGKNLLWTASGQSTAFDGTWNEPIAAGFAADYAVSDTFGVKARFGAAFAGSVKTGDVTSDIPFAMSFEAMPYVDLSILKLFVTLGANYTADSEGGDDDSSFKWHFNPYITKAAGGGTFFAGFYVNGEGDKDNTIKWGIPLGLEVSF
jgi:hypothetical protein